MLTEYNNVKKENIVELLNAVKRISFEKTGSFQPALAGHLV